jgi:hypothetical protein
VAKNRVIMPQSVVGKEAPPEGRDDISAPVIGTLMDE